jgi:rhodanese-related sulfurtransferase
MTKGSIPDPKEAEAFFRAKLSFTTGPVDVNNMIQQGEDAVIVDVRASEDYAQGHVPGAIHLPQDAWSNPTGLSKNARNVFYCYSQTCHLAAKAAYKFAALGYPVVEMEGGFQAWKEHDLKQEGGALKAGGKEESQQLRH